MTFLQRLSVSVFVLALSLTSFTANTSFAEEPSLTLRDSETIALIGDALIEQEQYSGWIELALTASSPEKNLKFRNLGWNADTPVGDSRFGLSLRQAGNEPADEGWKQLLAQIELVKPTLVIFGYGMASYLELGGDDTKTFADQFQKLIAETKRINPEVRFVFLSPISWRADGAGEHEDLANYRRVIHRIANAHNAPFIDLGQIPNDGHFHQDPIHLNEAGFKKAAELICQGLNLDAKTWQASLQADALRQVIVRKNEWWFHRTRPSNMAYVLGFRKHEQGQNAVELPQYEALIADEEIIIAKLRTLKSADVEQPKPRTESKFAKFTPQPHPEFTMNNELEVKLWAENPQLNKPIHMNFDAKGRLWVVSSEAYPMIEVGQSRPDKVIVLEDTDNDGVSDKSTVFADELLIPTGVLPTTNGEGVYVAQSTDLLYLKDTNNDGVADERTRVLSGFGTEDTHHNLHTLVRGYDGRIYMNQSVYTRTDTETPHGVVRLKAGGGFRFQPDALRMEIVFRGLWNSWGHQFDQFGNSFLTDGAGGNGVAYTFPGAMFHPTPGAARQLELISPGRWPKFASAEILYGDSFPKDWQGSMITCDFRANRVVRFSFEEDNAGFVTKQEDDLMRTSATSFRPIDVKQGPDGALYIADWSNPIINHGEVDFRDARRDRWHGRIWRVSWKGAKKKENVDLTKASLSDLFNNLTSADRYTREQSQAQLVSRRDQTVSMLPKWTSSLTTDEARLAALWLHESVDLANEDLLAKLLASKVDGVRTASVRVLSHWTGPNTDVDKPITVSRAMDLLGKAVNDPYPRVRLEAVRALGQLATADAGLLALAALDHPMDRFIEYGLWLTVNEASTPLTTELAKDDALNKIKPAHLQYLLTSINPNVSAQLLGQYLATHKIESNGAGPWIELLGKAGSQEQLTELFNRAVDGDFATEARVRVLKSLLDADRTRGAKPAGHDKIVALVASDNDAVRTSAAELIGQWKLGGATAALVKVASDEKATLEARRASLMALRQIQKPSANEQLFALATTIKTEPLRTDVLNAIAAVDLGRALPTLFAAMKTIESEEAAQALWRSMLVKKDAGILIASKLPDSGMTELVARAGLRVASEGRNEPELTAALLPLSGQLMTPESLTPERIAEYVKAITETGDAYHGEQIYRMKELACANCHAIGGVGGKVGPDMTSLGASAPVDYLVESIFNPNAKVKEGYHSVVLVTEDGQVVTGIEVKATEAQTTIRTADNKLINIPTREILEKSNGSSLMPVGVVDRLKMQDQVDLIAFLSKLGKPGDFDSSRGGVGRVYEVLAGSHVVEQNNGPQIIDGTLTKGWNPVLSLVNGGLPRKTLQELTVIPAHVSLVHVYLRTGFTTTEDKAVTFTVLGTSTAAGWIDGQPVEAKATTVDGQPATLLTGKAGSGAHRLLVRLDARQLPDSTIVKSGDVTFALE